MGDNISQFKEPITKVIGSLLVELANSLTYIES